MCHIGEIVFSVKFKWRTPFLIRSVNTLISPYIFIELVIFPVRFVGTHILPSAFNPGHLSRLIMWSGLNWYAVHLGIHKTAVTVMIGNHFSLLCWLSDLKAMVLTRVCRSQLLLLLFREHFRYLLSSLV